MGELRRRAFRGYPTADGVGEGARARTARLRSQLQGLGEGPGQRAAPVEGTRQSIKNPAATSH